MTFVVGEDEKGNKIAVEVNQGAQLSVSAPLFEMSLGNVTGYQPVIVEGNNDNVPSTGTHDIWESGTDLIYLTAAETMNIVSTDANDTSAGTGARTIRIKGLDNDFNEISETISLSGLSNVLTVNLYIRVFSLEQKTGDGGNINVGDITATSSSAATLQCIMLAGVGLSKNSHFTIPSGKKFILLSAELNATRTVAGMAPNMIVNALRREFGSDAPFITAVRRKMDTSVIDQLLIIQPVGQVINEKNDLKFAVTSDQDNTQVRIRYYGILVNI